MRQPHMSSVVERLLLVNHRVDPEGAARFCRRHSGLGRSADGRSPESA
ncbi:hypothetical protein AB0J28_06355 [Streptosporangium canum]